MEKEKLYKAAQLADDLKKVNRALSLFGPDDEPPAIRVSASVGGGTEDMTFAYLPKRISPAIRQVLVEAKDYIIKEMEEL